MTEEVGPPSMLEELSERQRGPDAERIIAAGRVNILYRLGRHYLFLPFAALCVAATLMNGRQPIWLVAAPLLLQIVVTFAAERLTSSYEHRAMTDDPRIWARHFTILSGVAGAIWGVGAFIWFVPNSFPAASYLTLAFLGITATEFIARGAYRPAYLAHAAFSLGPLAIRLLMEGEAYATMSSVLVLFFGGILYTYCDRFGEFLDESILLRWENVNLIVRLSREKRDAEKARDVAEAGTRAKTAFIANISHEIRTPLNALLGMAQLLERSELDRGQRGYVKVVLEAGRGLKTLLDDVIALSRDGDTVEASEEDCDAAQAARTVARLLQPRAWEKQLRFTVTAPSDLPRVAADPRRVRQVLLKLADNAMKFTEQGGVEIRVEPFTAQDGAQMLRFLVIDTGLGLTQESSAQLFEPFAVSDNSYTRRHDGAGLGLAVAKRTVESFGGQIGVESAPGEGATFWFTVPASRAASSEKSDAAPIASDAPPPSGLWFLLAISDAELRGHIANFLEPFGNRIDIAETAVDAISLAGRHNFDAIIVDAADADTLAASPGVRAPLLAIVAGNARSPVAAGEVLHWPASAGALYAALRDLLGRAMESFSPAPDLDNENVAAIDAPAFAALEKSLGLTTLTEILQSYVVTAQELCGKLDDASGGERWDDATRIAQDIAGVAGGLGLAALTAAARGFTQKARDGNNSQALQGAVKAVIAEHERVRRALVNLYPDLAA
jgi:signal transduction histidine kinase/HPt (histidine-containing phosphotransfer) domain-containing protein